MTEVSRTGAGVVSLLSMVGMVGLLLAGCGPPPGPRPDPNGPRSGTGFLVDPQTGITLPGQPDNGGGRR